MYEPPSQAAASLTRDLHAARPIVYWTDLIASAGLGYAGMAVAIVATPVWATLLGAVVVEHNPLYTPRELRHQFEDHGARVAIAWDRVVPLVQDLPEDLGVETVDQDAALDGAVVLGRRRGVGARALLLRPGLLRHRRAARRVAARHAER